MINGLFLPFGQSVKRRRRRMVLDDYSQENTLGDWTDPLPDVVLEDAFVASSSGTAQTSEDGTYVITTKSLYCGPDADVLAGDRIIDGATTYDIPHKPEADTNPFTGWQPLAEIPLREVTTR